VFRRISRKSLPAALLPIALAASVLLLVPYDDEPVSPPPGSIGPALPAATPDRLSLSDGRTLEGEVVSEGKEHLSIRLTDGSTVIVPRAEVASSARDEPRTGVRHRVRLRNGRTVFGQLLNRSPTSVELRLREGTLVTLSMDDVLAVEAIEDPR
jgi:hypothetical protein